MACAVILHDLTHVVIEFLAVFGLGHVDKVYDNYASHIAQTQLTGYFVGGAHVDFERIGLLVVGRLGAVAGVYVDDMQRLGVLDDEICTALKRYRLAKR